MSRAWMSAGPGLTGVTNYLRGVALMGDRFLVVGENGCVLWSDDGNNFQLAQVSLPPPIGLRGWPPPRSALWR